MKLAESCVLPARPEAVWAALNDPQVLSAALPGCKSLAMLDERHFESTIQVRVGPVAATFRGEVELADLVPPHSYTIIGRGNAGAVGFATLTARVALEDQGDTTLLRYDADVEIGGKLMSVGARLIQSVAAKNLEAFFSAFAKQLEQRCAAAAVEAGPVAAEAVEDAKERSADAAMPAATARLAGSAAVTDSQAAARASVAPQNRMLWTVGTAAGLAGFVIGFFIAHVV